MGVEREKENGTKKIHLTFPVTVKGERLNAICEAHRSQKGNREMKWVNIDALSQTLRYKGLHPNGSTPANEKYFHFDPHLGR